MRAKPSAAMSALMAATLLVPAGAGAACTPRDVCRDVVTTLVGTIIIDGVTRVRVQWNTSHEDLAKVDKYVVRRFNCDNPAECSQDVAIVAPTAGCGGSQSYAVMDTPPASPVPWKYTVEVWDKNGPQGAHGRVCAADTRPGQ